MNLINGFLSLFFPTQCITCKRYIKDFKYYYVCEECYKKIKFIEKPFCKICSKPLNSETVDICLECGQRKDTYFSYVKAVGTYEDALKDILQYYKFYKKEKLAKILVNFIFEKITQEFFKDIDFLVPVPLHKRSLKQKNFDHIRLITEIISKKTGIPVLKGLVKIKETYDQSQLKREERLKNLKDAFEILEKIKNLIKDKNFLIMDDIYTTGSTMNEVAKVLVKNGAKEVKGLVIARAL